MKFNFHLIPGFPRLAWCARLVQNNPIVEVYHGPWVEVREDRFFEGSWDGDFEGGRFVESPTFIGTGARAADQSILFATHTDMFAQLFSLRTEKELFVSNSCVNLLVQADDSPDPNYQQYYFDLLHARIWGIRPFLGDFPGTMPTARGRRIRIHLYANLRVTPNLKLERLEKTHPPQPADFESEGCAFESRRRARRSERQQGLFRRPAARREKTAAPGETPDEA